MSDEKEKRGWGKVILGTRLEKQVDAHFFEVWTKLVFSRCANGYLSERGRPAHQGANKIVRDFLKIPAEHADTLCFIDSDCIIEAADITAFRELEEGFDYDILQAFYARRGWPPDAVWFKEGSDGTMFNCMILDEQTGPVDAIGLHLCMIRRAVFERMLGDNDPKNFEWFYYPPGRDNGGEDVEFARDAKAAGFKLGATTKIKTGHLSSIISGWDTYQEYLSLSGTRRRTERFVELATRVGAYLGEHPDSVMNQAINGNGVRREWLAQNPQTPDQYRGFYGSAANNEYFYDLVRWNTTEFYEQITAPLAGVRDLDVLVIGGGIGGEVDALLGRNNNIDVYELPGRLRDYLEHEYGKQVTILQDPFGEIRFAYDAVVMVDVFEHVHPDEASAFLDTLLTAMRPAARLYCHNHFTQQGGVFPMHQDHSAIWNNWTEVHFERVGEFEWRRKW